VQVHRSGISALSPGRSSCGTCAKDHAAEALGRLKTQTRSNLLPCHF
jgi:hypothetical protein